MLSYTGGLVLFAALLHASWNAVLHGNRDRFLSMTWMSIAIATVALVVAVNMPGSERIYLFMTGGSHSFRVIYMDGRTHPTNPEPSPFGHSIGWWEGDTLAIDTVGFNEGAWMDRYGLPHTDQLHMLERVTRVDFNTLNYEVTIDDPGAYTAPWTSGYTKQWESGTDLFEYICQENNYAPQLMQGDGDTVRRSSIIVP